jgi:hypothetical protein
MIVGRRDLTMRERELVFSVFASTCDLRCLTEVVMCHVTRWPALAVGAERDGVGGLQPPTTRYT